MLCTTCVGKGRIYRLKEVSVGGRAVAYRTESLCPLSVRFCRRGDDDRVLRVTCRQRHTRKTTHPRRAKSSLRTSKHAPADGKERKCADTTGTVLVPRASHFQWWNIEIFSSEIHGSNFIKQHSETLTVWNWKNADCSLKNIWCHLL